MNKQQLRNVLPGGIHHKVASDWAASDDAELLVSQKGAWQVAVYPTFSEDCDYRLKAKTLRYRVALFRQLNGTLYTGTANSDYIAHEWPKNSGFIEWIDKDWQEVEVPHG